MEVRKVRLWMRRKWIHLLRSERDPLDAIPRPALLPLGFIFLGLVCLLIFCGRAEAQIVPFDCNHTVTLTQTGTVTLYDQSGAGLTRLNVRGGQFSMEVTGSPDTVSLSIGVSMKDASAASAISKLTGTATSGLTDLGQITGLWPYYTATLSDLTGGTNPAVIIRSCFSTTIFARSTGGVGGAWGEITGTLSNQTDLNSALSGKQATSAKDQASGYAGLDSGGLLAASELPNPTASTLGGVQSGSCPVGAISAINADGTVSCVTIDPTPTGDGVPEIVAGVQQAAAKAFQGTDTKVMTSGTVSGTGASLCTDANGGATTSGCGGSTDLCHMTSQAERDGNSAYQVFLGCTISPGAFTSTTGCFDIRVFFTRTTGSGSPNVRVYWNANTATPGGTLTTVGPSSSLSVISVANNVYSTM